MATLTELEHWLTEAEPGDRIVYHNGNLSVDRLRFSVETGVFTETPIEPINSIGLLMWRAYEEGRVRLTQQRLGPWEFRYWATITNKAKEVKDANDVEELPIRVEERSNEPQPEADSDRLDGQGDRGLVPDPARPDGRERD